MRVKTVGQLRDTIRSMERAARDMGLHFCPSCERFNRAGAHSCFDAKALRQDHGWTEQTNGSDVK